MCLASSLTLKELFNGAMIFQSFFLLSVLLRINCSADYNNLSKDKQFYRQYGRNVTELLDTLLQGYDKGIRPDLDEGVPIRVNIDIAVRSMGPISEKDMYYSMDCYFRQTWKDNRLKFESSTEEALSLGAVVLDKIWKPDTYFWNGLDSYLHRLTVPNRFIRLKQDGTVHYSSRLTIKASCPMYLHNFPLDEQKCPLLIGSFAYSSEDVLYAWRKGVNDSVTANSDLELSQYVLRTIATSFTNQTRVAKEGDFSILTVHFHLERHIGFFLINFYAPCTLIVVLSWVAFWINREATADRIGLGITVHQVNSANCKIVSLLLGATSILTMTFMALDSKMDLPKVTYATALDVYMVLCYAFVLGTIAEFSIVHAFTKYNTGDPELRYLEKERVEKVKKHMPQKTEEPEDKKNGGVSTIPSMYSFPGLPNLQKILSEAKNEKDFTPTEDTVNIFQKMFSQWAETGRKSDASSFDVNSTSRVDRIARMVFPLCFTFSSVVYWYTYWRSH